MRLQPVQLRVHAREEVPDVLVAARVQEDGVEAVVGLVGGARVRRAQRPQVVLVGALVPERLPPNDGGIAYGQAAVAAAVSA